MTQAFNIDCMEGMAKYPDGYFELAIVDPPYGIGYEKGGQYFENKYAKKSWDRGTPSAEYFAELERVSKNRIIWGGNYFSMPPCRCFVVWYKTDEIKGRTFSECEYAWTSFNEPSRQIEIKPFQRNGTRIHPTQKPVALYRWLLKNYAKAGDKILDTHLGSGSSRIAAHEAGHEFVGFELDSDYFQAQEKRFEKYIAQQVLAL